ncbi:MAG: large conductance mechanosensitive channel protein MscL [Leptospirales bacterium]
MLKEFKVFIMRGNVMDMAVGIIMGTSFGAIVQSLVSDIIMPLIGLLLGNRNTTNLFLTLKEGTPSGPYPTVSEAHKDGALTLDYGIFLNTVIRFLIVGLAVFFMIRFVNRLTALLAKKEDAPTPTTTRCPYCISNIPLEATRCPQCTSTL